MDLKQFRKELLKSKSNIDRTILECERCEKKQKTREVTQSKKIDQLWKDIETVLDEWEPTICVFLNEMGRAYWGVNSFTKACVINKQEDKNSFLQSIDPHDLYALTNVWTWYVEGLPEPYKIGHVFPIFGVRLHMCVTPSCDNSIDYFLTVIDRSGKSRRYKNADSLKERLLEAFVNGPHIPGQAVI